ncbi:hypothetical protein BU24DRAFT_431684 [Aaosphaeria arxii CBS 175.79]|uniref:Uncharacterized protein n=1 Tax=Aaosphaeria arxii CBS 175.79 TaxID=1450172 RepID=A0A6A5Y6G0_9PLEO|nr:uncharacterized protein BU24DRAFT_431684 [Aaosphaeria arxii CBS 175.79]KAF2020144.1 hypothetical protein BU24DRAFT_431684 [Aaosphaeria arxii CBS 175.79]
MVRSALDPHPHLSPSGRIYIHSTSYRDTAIDCWPHFLPLSSPRLSSPSPPLLTLSARFLSFPISYSSHILYPIPIHSALSYTHTHTIFPCFSILSLTDVSPATCPLITTKSLNLRLPSFDLLGIAAPHPDRIAVHSPSSFSPLGAGPLSKPEDPLHALSPSLIEPERQLPQIDGTVDSSPPSPEAARAKVQRLVPVVTPPNEEPGTFNWGSFVNVGTAAVGSPPNSEPGVSPGTNITSLSAVTAETAETAVPDPLSVTDLSDALGMAAWIESIRQILTSDVSSARHDSIKVLSHALPSPSLTGHLFAQIISAIHERTTTSTSWINVFHAVPGRFTLADLPKSPPSTPGQVVGGDEYFTSKIFDTAVAVPDYQLDARLLPPSPRPVVPPGSVNVSVVERYIPPTNENEFVEMFSMRGGHSLLLDRLIEVSPDNGRLLFIYPTRTGAQTFMRSYLGPVLDPLLRSMTIVHDLSSDLSKSLGPMKAVDRLPEYVQLDTRLRAFCNQLNQDENHLRTSGSTYSIIHASREEIVIDRASWAKDWWIKQEKPRIREAVTRYFRKAKVLPRDTSMTPSNLIQEILDGVANRECERLVQPRGIEVGVFVIQKSR